MVYLKLKLMGNVHFPDLYDIGLNEQQNVITLSAITTKS